MYQKQYPFACCLPEPHFRSKYTHGLKVKGWEKIFHENKNQNKARVAILWGEGNGNPLQHSCLENPRDRGAWWAAVSGVTQGQTL